MKQKKKLIEIFTNKRGWVIVELLKVNNNGTILIRLDNGQVILRKNKRVRWFVVRRVTKKYADPDKRWRKSFKSKKRRRKYRKENKKKSKGGKGKGHRRVKSFHEIVNNSGLLKGKHRNKRPR